MTLAISGVSYSVTEGTTERQIISRLSYTFQPGRITAVVGPSGCGKTTLLSLLSLLVKPDAGSMHFDEKDLCMASEVERQHVRRNCIGLMFQSARILKILSMDEQLRFTAASFGRSILTSGAKTYTESLGIGDLSNHIPSQMSAGEKQRLALVLAVMKRPMILLADEPTASLDYENSKHLFGCIRDYTKERRCISIVVTHDRYVINNADECLSLES